MNQHDWGPCEKTEMGRHRTQGDVPKTEAEGAAMLHQLRNTCGHQELDGVKRGPPRETSKTAYRLKVKGWKKIFHANRDQKKAGVAILTSDKIDFKTKAVERDTCTPMFITALFIIARTWKQPRYQREREWQTTSVFLP